ncbi:beta-1 adrenergic receptor-like isoform X2 [Rhopilema esculentum]|uniref:beta-1 adrenergic receptor-like isoform X2 n=1 Tax=Rhopilema esculentum TaxID=499914 RepID=UPI0031D6A2B6
MQMFLLAGIFLGTLSSSSSLSYHLCKTIHSSSCNNTFRKYYRDVPFIWNKNALKLPRRELTGEGVVLALIMIPSLLGNGALIAMVTFENKFRTPTNLLVISQCIADLLMTFFVISLSAVAVAKGGWRLHQMWCLFQVTANRAILFVTCLHFALLAIDRYIVIVKTKSTDRFSKQQILVACSVLWFIALIFAFPWDVFFFPREVWFEVTSTFCYARYTFPGQKNSTILIFARIIGILTIPGLVIIFCFYHIFSVVRTNRRKVGPSTVSNWRKIAVAVYAKSAYTSMAVLVSFCLCVLPFIAVYGLSIIGNIIHYRTLMASKHIIYANSAIKPIIYIIRSVPWSKKMRVLLNRRRKATRTIADSPAFRRSSKYVVGNSLKSSALSFRSQTSTRNTAKQFSSKDFHELFCVDGVKKAWEHSLEIPKMLKASK